jgi:hypothetical protein
MAFDRRTDVPQEGGERQRVRQPNDRRRGFLYRRPHAAAFVNVIVQAPSKNLILGSIAPFGREWPIFSSETV